MAKKIVKKRKLKVLNFFLVLLVLAGIFFGCYYVSLLPTKLLLVEGNHLLSDDEILEMAGAKDYPKFVLFPSSKAKKNLEKSKYIKNAKIEKKWGFLLKITVEETKPLFYYETSKVYVLSSSETIREDEMVGEFRVPRVLNYVPDSKYKKFIAGMNKVDDDILCKISDMEYQPNDFDKDRFLLYMDDGNMVYLTLTKFKMINHYNEVLQQLENHKGILYLDSGNHFKIKE